MFSVKIGNELYVIIASYKVRNIVLSDYSEFLTSFQEALDIMQKHSADTADRPRSVAGGEIISNNLRAVFVSSGDRLRRLRRWADTPIAYNEHIDAGYVL